MKSRAPSPSVGIIPSPTGRGPGTQGYRAGWHVPALGGTSLRSSEGRGTQHRQPVIFLRQPEIEASLGPHTNRSSPNWLAARADDWESSTVRSLRTTAASGARNGRERLNRVGNRLRRIALRHALRRTSGTCHPVQAGHDAIWVIDASFTPFGKPQGVAPARR